MLAATAVDVVLPLRDRVLAYLGAHTTMGLCTAGPDGPWAATILYVNDGLALYFTSVAETRHTRQMLATGRVAGVVHDECTSWIGMKGLQLVGTVALVTDLGERRAAVRAYLARFPFAAGMWNGESDPEVIARDPGIHGFYRIAPTELHFTDNEHAPGRREELALR